jgi:protein-disulfide isomerase
VEIFAERSELAAQYPNLVIDQHLLIRYPFAEFFFVSPESPKLAKAIQTGLERAYADGSFMAFFRRTPRSARPWPAPIWSRESPSPCPIPT